MILSDINPLWGGAQIDESLPNIFGQCKFRGVFVILQWICFPLFIILVNDYNYTNSATAISIFVISYSKIKNIKRHLRIVMGTEFTKVSNTNFQEEDFYILTYERVLLSTYFVYPSNNTTFFKNFKQSLQFTTQQYL